MNSRATYPALAHAERTADKALANQCMDALDEIDRLRRQLADAAPILTAGYNEEAAYREAVATTLTTALQQLTERVGKLERQHDIDREKWRQERAELHRTYRADIDKARAAEERTDWTVEALR